ncbi:MAG: hypothetical protein IPI30_09450 [Saprospiraceae bacterium]|nr:hypothetical protein [Candidatus Vicinibacter affinis]
MKSEILPGKQIGTFDAKDINYASKYLSNLVKYQLTQRFRWSIVLRKHGYQCQIDKKYLQRCNSFLDMDGLVQKN